MAHVNCRRVLFYFAIGVLEDDLEDAWFSVRFCPSRCRRDLWCLDCFCCAVLLLVFQLYLLACVIVIESHLTDERSMTKSSEQRLEPLQNAVDNKAIVLEPNRHQVPGFWV
jgi:hypothetical protein